MKQLSAELLELDIVLKLFVGYKIIKITQHKPNQFQTL